jgi:integrase
VREHRRRQARERREAGERWIETGYVFINSLAEPLNLDYLTRRFRCPVDRSGLPPVRLRDLRHGAATLAHAAGADLTSVQEQLGHTSIVLTADTHTSVLMSLHFRVAEVAARLVLAAAAKIPGPTLRRAQERPTGRR